MRKTIAIALTTLTIQSILLSGSLRAQDSSKSTQSMQNAPNNQNAQNNQSAQTIDETILKEYPVLFQQQSAEYRALCYQAFNIALVRINALSKKQLKKEKLAIITDLDETIIDNSYHEAQLIKDGKKFNSADWKRWTSQSAATAVPGSVEFLQAAKQKGISIFYISNRDTSELAATMLNLNKLQLPDADTAHIFLMAGSSAKEPRRQRVMNNHHVILLMGDNLNDFMTLFEKKASVDRKIETDKLKAEWGNKFIVLPNSMYGEWENAIYNYNRELTPLQREGLRRQTLIGF